MSKQAILATIHQNVKNRFTYQTDQEQFGKQEHWYTPAIGDGLEITGDCEDFALACRALCHENGIYHCRLVVCVVARGNQEGQGHCVLEVDGHILDNRQKSVKTINQLEQQGEYKWIAISGYEHSDPWRKINGVD